MMVFFTGVLPKDVNVTPITVSTIGLNFEYRLPLLLKGGFVGNYIITGDDIVASYYEVKQLLCRLFGNRLQEENNDDIIIELHTRYMRENQAENRTTTIFDSELLELYNEVINSTSENMELLSENTYEIAIDWGYPMMRGRVFPLSSSDTTNGISYKLGFPSLRYCIYLLIKIKDAMNDRGERMIPVRLRRPVDYTRYLEQDEIVSWQNILPHLLGDLSLKITCADISSLSEFRSRKTSFVFDFMYRSGIALVEFSDIVDMFHINNVDRGRYDLSQIDTPPLRNYSVDVVDYYRLALASNDSYIKYISFYHIMEFFFDEVFKKKLVNDLQSKITHPDFSYKNEEKIYEIAQFVKNRFQINNDAGQGNELESLKFVLGEYIIIDEVKDRIENISPGSVQYYQTTKVQFCSAPTIPWADMNGVYTHIAKRIYYTRNSLVHSKSGKNQTRYRPYKDDIYLQREIPLVKAIAELIIIHSSSIM